MEFKFNLIILYHFIVSIDRKKSSEENFNNDVKYVSSYGLYFCNNAFSGILF